jgi:hypothetical protein
LRLLIIEQQVHFLSFPWLLQPAKIQSLSSAFESNFITAIFRIGQEKIEGMGSISSKLLHLYQESDPILLRYLLSMYLQSADDPPKQL